MEPPVQPDVNWRDLITLEDRIKVCQQIMTKLSAVYHATIPEHSLLEKTSAFEAQAYNKGESRHDYLRRITAGLRNMDLQAAEQQKERALEQQRAAASSAANMSAPQMHAKSAARQLSLQQLAAEHQRMFPMANMQQLQNQMMQGKQNMPAPGYPQATPEVKPSSSRGRIGSGSIASGAAIARSKALSQNAIAQQDISRLNSLNPNEQAAHLGADLNRQLMAVNTQNAASSQNLQERLQQAAALKSSHGQLRKQTPPSQPSAAGIAGFFPSDPIRNLIPEQISQILTINAQDGTVPGVSPAISPGMNDSSLALSHNRVINAQMLQQLRMQQNANMQARLQDYQAAKEAQAQAMQAHPVHLAQAEQTAQVGYNVNNPSHVARVNRVATGMSVRQMSTFMAQAPHNEKLRVARNQYGNIDRSRLAAAQANANPQRQQQIEPGKAGSEEFWAKLDAMKLKYAQSLKDLLPYITTIANGQRPNKREQFKKHIKDCFLILQISRGNIVPSSLTTTLLDKASKFMDNVISVTRNARRGSSSRQPQQVAAQPAKMTASQYAMAQTMATAKEAGSHAAHAQREMLMNFQRQQLSQQQQPGAALAAGKNFQGAAKVGARESTSGMQSSTQSGKSRKLNAAQAAQPAIVSKPNQFQAGRNPGGRVTGQPAGLTEAQRNSLQHHAMTPQTRQADQQFARGGYAQQSALHQSAIEAEGAARRAAVSDTARKVSQMMRNSAQKQMQMNSVRPQSQIPAPHHGVVKPQVKTEQQIGAQAKEKPRNAVPTEENVALSMAPELPRPRVSLNQSVQNVELEMKRIYEHTLRWESTINSDWKRGKAERIQNTLTALRNNRSSETGNGYRNPKKRPSSFVDVDNCTDGDTVIRSKTVFECSSEQGLRLAKRPKNESAEIKSAREAVEADCKAAEKKNPIISFEIGEEYGHPVVECMLLIEEIKLPKLTLRVPRCYPRKGSVTYRFSIPPLGWTGVVGLIREAFRRSLVNVPTSSIGVATILDSWATEAEVIVAKELRCSESEVLSSEDEKETAVSLVNA